VDVVDHFYEGLVFLVRLDARVVDVGGSAKVVDLGLAVVVSDASALLSSQAEELALLLGRQTLEVLDALLHLFLKERKEGVILILHDPALDTAKGSLEGLLLDINLGSGVLKALLNGLKGSESNVLEVVSQVLGLKVLDHLEHVQGSAVEVLLYIQFLISEIVDKSSLLHKVVLGNNAEVLHLLLGVSEVSKLLLFSDIGPH